LSLFIVDKTFPRQWKAGRGTICYLLFCQEVEIEWLGKFARKIKSKLDQFLIHRKRGAMMMKTLMSLGNTYMERRLKDMKILLRMMDIKNRTGKIKGK